VCAKDRAPCARCGQVHCTRCLLPCARCGALLCAADCRAHHCAEPIP
jgi:hypothetical protein